MSTTQIKKPCSDYSRGEIELLSSKVQLYPMDDGLPTQKQMEAINRLTPQDLPTQTITSLFR